MSTPTVELQESLAPARVGIYQIAREMAELVVMAETAETDEELEAVQQALQQYVTFAEIQKVDNIARSIKHLTENVGTASKPGRIDDEIRRLQAIKKRQAGILDFLKGAVISVMQMGKVTKLASATNRLRIQKNSQASVDITEPEKVPDRFLEVTVVCTNEYLRWLRKQAADEGFDVQIKVRGTDFKRSEIAEAIRKSMCVECGGSGYIIVRGDEDEKCLGCEGRGHTFRGATLTQGVHLRCE
jgi:hypothetical protein